MKTYKCFKTVKAAKITEIEKKTKWESYFLHLDSGEIRAVTEGWFNNRAPHVDGYFVEYQDGYTSFSPADAFESGYIEIQEAA